MLERIDAYAPGTSASSVGIDIIAPPDLRAHNVNAEAGDSYTGSTELDQSLLWRPTVGAGKHRTTIPGLWHIGASTHPGPGLSGESGWL